mgnify:FL=1
MNFEPLAEFIVEDGGWLDITLISDSPLLEHDAMYMMQNIEKSRHRQLERKARENRRRALAVQSGMTEAELQANEQAQADARKGPSPKEEAPVAPKETKAPAKKATATSSKTTAKGGKDDNEVFDFEEDDDDLF